MNQTVFGSPFIGASSAAPLCGMPTNLQFAMTKMRQAQIKSDVTAKTIFAGQPVIIDNRVGAPGTAQIAGFNADVLEITALATTTSSASTVCGFVLCSDLDKVDTDGGTGYAHAGDLVNVGLIGSGVETYLPASADCANIALTTGLCWDSTNAELDVPASSELTIGLKVLGSLVDGYKLKKNATSGLMEWVATKCLKVQL
jgi:hypothetical protein